MVTPKQFLGIEIKEWAKEITELVLWIGWLQWQIRTRGYKNHPDEPILHDYHNIERGDAVLDDKKKAEWPEAEFVVGNPPYIGSKRMPEALSEEYVSSLRIAHDDVPESSDYVMYWWNHAANLLAQHGRLKQFGFITTNSITQKTNRQVVAKQLAKKNAMSIGYAIADHLGLILRMGPTCVLQ